MSNLSRSRAFYQWCTKSDSLEVKDKDMRRTDIPSIDSISWEEMRGREVYYSEVDSAEMDMFDFREEDWSE